jgi:hypothetical protein
MLNHFTPLHPCNVGLYSLAGGKNKLGEKKINITRGETKKNFTGKKQNSPTLQG